MAPRGLNQERGSTSGNLASGDYPFGQDALANSSQDSGIHPSDSDLIKTRQIVRSDQSLRCPYISLCYIALERLRQMDTFSASSRAEIDSLHAASSKAKSEIQDQYSHDPEKGPRPVVVDLHSAHLPVNLLALLDDADRPAKCWGFPIGTFNNIKDFDTLGPFKKEFAIPLEVEGQTPAEPEAGEVVLKTNPTWKVGKGKGTLAYVIAIPVPMAEIPTRSDAWSCEGRNAPSSGVIVTMERPSYEEFLRLSRRKIDKFLERVNGNDGLAYVEQCLREMDVPDNEDKSFAAGSSHNRIKATKKLLKMLRS